MSKVAQYGPSEDQMTFNSEIWGLLTFFPAKTNKWTDTCRHCLLYDNSLNGCTPECFMAPCSDFQRYDKQGGYFAIHDMPNDKTSNQ